MAIEKLYIYDSSSSIDRSQAAGRFSGDATVSTLPTATVADLHTGLSGLVATHQTFKRVLFQTHGNSGMIFFNGAALKAADLRSSFSGKSYDRLFRSKAKIYFDGCNVAEGGAGWDFLAAAGETFLRSGGIAMGWTSMGSGMPGWVPFIGGHTEHFWGDTKVIQFGPGGVEMNRYDFGDMSLFEQAQAYTKLRDYF